MRILVGIMYCIENEFEQCKKAIQQQTHQDWELFTIEQLPNKPAHDLLYQTFMNRAEEFDFFIKVDADMVLCESTFFEEVIAEMAKNPTATHFQIGVWDHFMNRMVKALHVYRNSVKWRKNEDAYFVDMVHQETSKKYYLDKAGPLAPAADHCPNPSEFQSFHFGVHVVAKILQNDLATEFKISPIGFLKKMQAVILQYQEKKSNQHLYALLGLIWAFEYKVTSREVDYQSRITRLNLEKFQKMTSTEREQIIENWINQLPASPNKKWFINSFTYRYLDKQPLLVAKSRAFLQGYFPNYIK